MLIGGGAALIGAMAGPVSVLASTTVDLARAQFATTSLYHFIFVPLSLGLAPLVATMQTIWHRTNDDAWLRLTRSAAGERSVLLITHRPEGLDLVDEIHILEEHRS
jgi:hypothetical protein